MYLQDLELQNQEMKAELLDCKLQLSDLNVENQELHMQCEQNESQFEQIFQQKAKFESDCKRLQQ